MPVTLTIHAEHSCSATWHGTGLPASKVQAAFVTATELKPMEAPPGSEEYVRTAKHVCTVDA